jgi:hypothetical protein
MKACYVNLIVVLFFTCSVRASDPGPNYRHLKHLEQMIGAWTYEGKDSNGRIVRGSEQNGWIHNRSYVRVEGTWHSEGTEPISYELSIGWDAARNMEVLNGTLSTGATFHREGHYDKQKNATISKETSVQPDGTTNTAVCTLTYGNDPDSWSGLWTDCTEGGTPVGDTFVTFTRVGDGEQRGEDASVTADHKTVTKLEFAEYCAAMQGRWYNANEHLADWMDLGDAGEGESIMSYSIIAPIADGKGLAGDFFAGSGSGKWVTVWNPVTRRLQILSIISDGTVWEEIRYKRDGEWQCEVTLSHPDGTQRKIESVLTISSDGNRHTYRTADDQGTAVYTRVSR